MHENIQREHTHTGRLTLKWLRDGRINSFVDFSLKAYSGGVMGIWVSSMNFYINAIPPIYLHWDFMKFWLSPVWNIQLDFFSSLNWEKIPVWNTKLAKSKIPVRVVKNVISKWTKMEFPRFPFLWFTAVGVVNPPDQKLVMYISVNCKKGINS